jgi:membrane-bound lytic murein transglycosylase A
MKKLSLGTWPDIMEHGNLSDLKKGVAASLQYLSALPRDHKLPFGNGHIPVTRVKASLDAFSHLLEMTEGNATRLSEEVRRMFDLYLPEDSGNTSATTDKRQPATLVTGYFQPLIKASYNRTPQFTYPVYSRPPDLVQARLSRFSSTLPDRTVWGRVEQGSLRPYYSRYEIDYGGAPRLPTPVAWLPSPVDGLMLQIQGSGILLFPDNSQRFIHYAASNGKPYGSIGKWLIRQGYIKAEDADWPSIRKWCETHPEKFREAAKANPRYIFFKWEKQGPTGSMGAVLTPMRSVALDHSIIPKGALCFLEFSMPPATSDHDGSNNFAGFVLNQDKGSAIKGAGRVDLYCGAGEKAGRLAGRLKNRGNLYILLLKP